MNGPDGPIEREADRAERMQTYDDRCDLYEQLADESLDEVQE